jgi:ATP-dependent Clp protease ATP-binding subunit ClpA
MFERFSTAGRRAVEIAHAEAHAFGHRAIGTEHLLLGVAAQDDQWAAQALVQRGLTAARVRSEIERIIGRGPAAPFAPGLDAGALATVGIDLEQVRRRVEATFGPGALAPLPACRRGEMRPGELPFTRRAKKALELATREFRSHGCREIEPHHVALGVLRAGGNGAHILAEHGITAPLLGRPARLAGES